MDVQPWIPERAAPNHREARVDLATAFRWTARRNMHEMVAIQHSRSVIREGTRFLINPNRMQSARIRASDLLELDTSDTDASSRSGVPGPAVCGLHGPLHRRNRHARRVMHLDSIIAIELTTIEDSTHSPVDLNTATFFHRMIVDEVLCGVALEAEDERCAAMLADPRVEAILDEEGSSHAN